MIESLESPDISKLHQTSQGSTNINELVKSDSSENLCDESEIIELDQDILHSHVIEAVKELESFQASIAEPEDSGINLEE